MKYHFKIHKESNGFWAECIELEGCSTQADTRSELNENMREVLNLFLSEPESSSLTFPMPKKQNITKSVVAIEVESNVAFSLLLRMARLKRKLTLREMADKLQYKNLNTYVKLEKATTANPELKTLAKIKKYISDFPINLIFS